MSDIYVDYPWGPDTPVVRTPHVSISKAEAVSLFYRHVNPGFDVVGVMLGIGRGWGPTIKAITGVKPTEEHIRAFRENWEPDYIGKVNRYFMFRKDTLEKACFNAVGLG